MTLCAVKAGLWWRQQGSSTGSSTAAAAGSAAQTAASTARITAQLTSSLGSSLGAGGASRQTGGNKHSREGEGSCLCLQQHRYDMRHATNSQHKSNLLPDSTLGVAWWEQWWFASKGSWALACAVPCTDPQTHASWAVLLCLQQCLPHHLPCMPVLMLSCRALRLCSAGRQPQQHHQQQWCHAEWALPAGVCGHLGQPGVAVGAAAAGLPKAQLPDRRGSPTHHRHQQQHTGGFCVFVGGRAPAACYHLGCAVLALGRH